MSRSNSRSGNPKAGPEQLELPFGVAAPALAPVPVPAAGLRLIRGGGESKMERLGSRESVVRVLLEAGVDLLLRRISPQRAEAIEARVDRVLRIFDQMSGQTNGQENGSDDKSAALRLELDELERLMTETRAQRPPRRRSV